MSEQQKISSPTFDHYDSFTTADLQDLLGAWQWIGSNSGWAEWHEYAVKFISELEVELQQRGAIAHANLQNKPLAQE